MKLTDRKPTKRSLSTYFFFAVGVIIAVRVVFEIHTIYGWLAYLFSIISPFVIGFALAYILNIPASQFQKLFSKSKGKWLDRHKKILSVLLTYLILILLVVVVVRLVVPAISNSVMVFAGNFNTYYANAQRAIDYINSLSFVNMEITMNGILNALRDYSLENLSSSLNASVEALSGIFSGLFTTFLALVSSIYILLEKEKFKGFACRALRAATNSTVYSGLLKYLTALNTYFRQYIYCQTIDGMILGTMATLELLLIIRSPYFLLLGVMLGIVNYIPYFGSIIGSLVAVAVVGFTQGLPMAVLAAVVLLVTQQIDGNLVQPRLMGKSFALSPLLIIIGITFGGALAGPLGMIAAIPIVAVLKNMVDDFIVYLEGRKKQAPQKQQEEPAADTNLLSNS